MNNWNYHCINSGPSFRNMRLGRGNVSIVVLAHYLTISRQRQLFSSYRVESTIVEGHRS